MDKPASMLLAQIDVSIATPCDVCGCPGRWLDYFDVPHCEICEPAPIQAMVKTKQFLFSGDWTALDGSDDQFYARVRQNQRQSPFNGFDPFGDSSPPAGVFFPIADRPTFVPCDHAGADLRRERCTNGIWDRVLCSRCGRLLELADAISFDNI